MFGPVQPTEFDLQFTLFGIPVRVIPTFWLLAALLGWSSLASGWEYLVTWLAVVFVSILVHELGHALTALAFGYPPRIFLYHFGGVAMFSPYGDYTAGKSILITLAGPGAGLCLGAIAFVGGGVLLARGEPVAPLVHAALNMLLIVNIVWSLLNLLPVLPLDGGQICRDVCTSLNPRRGELWATRIAMVVAGAVALWAFSEKNFFLGVMFGLMCYQNFQELQIRRGW
jgi:Zn-dependent protease